MKFQSCRWKHFDFRANVKVLAQRLQRTADELAMTIARVFSENTVLTLLPDIIANGDYFIQLAIIS
ncbi:hypothetical protein DPMN_158710 [Dreissena polymorpha]|uniref:Uncharacterized protein n=1 Tax=Dreissena polymorpha TaxID=45954 RepID=A0A9D4EMU5_DREPO|nr:hypothetical protein DPMN_158710 [Dreissena polymorpha]